MAYKAVVIDYAPKAARMVALIEDKANEMEPDGWKLVTVTITNSAKAIMVFYKQEKQAQTEEPALNMGAP